MSPSESTPPGARRSAVVAGLVGLAAILATVQAVRAGCFRQAPIPGEGRLTAQYDPEDAPASRLKPARIELGVGPANLRDEERLDNGFTVSFSADARRVAVVGGRTGDAEPGLWVTTAPGVATTVAPRRVAAGVMDAVFSPVGRTIAFTQFQADGSVSVKAISVDGGTAMLVARKAQAPVWGPDGGRILYLAEGEAEGIDLYIGSRPTVSGRGGALRRLAADVAAVRPAFGRNGATVYFVKGAGRRLFSVPADGGAPARPLEGLPAHVDELSASRDGAYLCFLQVTQPATVSPEGVSEPARGAVRLLEIATGGLTSPFGERDLTHPRLSADGRRVWACTMGGLVVSDVGTGGLGFVPVGRLRAFLPTPSPDGRRLMVISPMSDVAAALITIELGVFAKDETLLVVTDILPTTRDPEDALERLRALETAAIDDTSTPGFPPGYPVALPSGLFPELAADRIAVVAGRFDIQADAEALAGRLRSAGVTATVVPVR